ncbi:hypothetical protein BpHYR1_016809 [Brachionus plicatilis]|uniref:Uncharacterized protein n=1 Tax=Brachionus plicatilis TaxID=10195 RepID=A0A3M7PWA9_BRAPC|nr:hypothetical protein BpHYR1_016809 [Brachionus plicatilis]
MSAKTLQSKRTIDLNTFLMACKMHKIADKKRHKKEPYKYTWPITFFKNTLYFIIQYPHTESYSYFYAEKKNSAQITKIDLDFSIIIFSKIIKVLVNNKCQKRHLEV